MAWEWLGPVTTAVVGVAGVAGTVWTAHAGRRHQLEAMKAQGTIGVAVALAAEKRMVYARFLQLARAAFEEASVLVFDGTALPMDEASLPPLPPGSKLEYTGRYEAGTPFALAMAELNKCYDEVVIVGGHEVGTDASAAMSAISGYVSGTVDVWGVHRTLGDLSTAMHEDANRVRVNGSSSRRTA
ncbi:hypothetical protein [Verrucosispora sp. FIM060022]|uniref:hypothetical protein n=1 Tax=Verrucosispora sp. FIM060022 TaxID=1479020 RepID=UPI000F85E5CF|nr:hypothetical protein [Verrucosispora sp. FIM060022]RUL93694.1 hypothetical protein EG812_08330 [Verrucosispora sp. FIM060022]